MARERLVKDPPPEDPPPAAAAPPAEPASEPEPPAGAAAPPAGQAPAKAKKAPKAKAPAAAASDAGAPAEAVKVSSRAEELARQLAAELAAEDDAQHERAPLPFSETPTVAEQLAQLVTKVIDEGLGLDINSEYDELERGLVLPDALTPMVVAAAINLCESNAKRAHRLYVLARYQFDRYKIQAEVALGAMREAATHRLGVMKAAGQHPKQVTDSDVKDMAATMFPDEWVDINDRFARTEHTLAHLARFADLWQRRSWSLSALKS